jgi:hypothetical protein
VDKKGFDPKFGSKKLVANHACRNTPEHLMFWKQSEKQIETPSTAVKRNRHEDSGLGAVERITSGALVKGHETSVVGVAELIARG